MKLDRRRIWGLALAGAALLASCNDDSEKGYAPASCRHAKPDTGYMVVQCTIDKTFRRVPITIFRGDYELGNVALRDTLTTRETEYEMPVSKRFTVMAFYPIGRDTILVLDSAELRVFSDEYLDATCYRVATQTVDVRLRD
jgi:hypothetical protein